MNLIDIHDAADMMNVPVVWVDGMIKQGLLAEHDGRNSTRLIDADEIIVKRYVSREFEAPSMEHIQSMLKKLLPQSEKPISQTL